jgi:fucose 4-O-acetylase-like acetyltransferase
MTYTPTGPQVPAATPTSTVPSSPAKERDPFFDNAKFLTIILVVVGHTWAQLSGSNVEHAAYLAVYGFHMPLFVFMTGYFSRGYTRSTGKFRGLIPTVLAPYVIFVLLYRAELYFLKDHHFRAADWLAPQYVMWFLAALVCWRLTAPIWQHLRFPVATSVAVALVMGGWSMTSDGTVSRMVGLLPFFVLGLTIAPGRVAAVRRVTKWWMGVPVLLAAFVAAYLWGTGSIGGTVARLLYWNDNYAAMKLSTLEGMAGRLAALALAIVLGCAFLSLVPGRRTWFTDMGTRTMYVFLLHGLVIKVFDYTGLMDEPAVQSGPGVLLCTLAAIVLAVVLSTELVRRATRWAVEPPVGWLLARL